MVPAVSLTLVSAVMVRVISVAVSAVPPAAGLGLVFLLLVILLRPLIATPPEVARVHVSLLADLLVHIVPPFPAVLLAEFLDDAGDPPFVRQRWLVLLVVGHQNLLVLLHVGTLPWARARVLEPEVHRRTPGAIGEHVSLFRWLCLTPPCVAVRDRSGRGRSGRRA